MSIKAPHSSKTKQGKKKSIMAIQRSGLLSSIFLFIALFSHLHPAITAAGQDAPAPTPSHDDTATPAAAPTPSHHSTATPAAAPTPSHHGSATPAAAPTSSHRDSAAPTKSHPATADSKALEFLHEYCGDTPSPDYCYSSLSRYADTIKEDPNVLIRYALSVSLNKARRLATYIAESSAASSLHDCSSGLEDALDQIRDSVKQFRRYSSGIGATSAQISNIQTWMNSGLTKVDSCTEGLKGVKDVTMKMEAENLVAEVKKSTNVAIALVNRYASQVNL